MSGRKPASSAVRTEHFPDAGKMVSLRVPDHVVDVNNMVGVCRDKDRFVGANKMITALVAADLAAPRIAGMVPP
ncbi:MAG: hypothetical protein ACREP2_07540 [Rhodanobacteraceae bacterium]